MFTDSFGPFIAIELLPPYCEGLVPRKNVADGEVGAEAPLES